jgi:hypothetical protein
MIAVRQARMILGKRYSHLTDQNIEKIVALLFDLCKNVIREVVKKPYETKSNHILPGVLR